MNLLEVVGLYKTYGIVRLALITHPSITEVRCCK